MDSPNYILFGAPSDLIIWAVFLVIVGIIQLFRFIYRAFQQLSESQGEPQDPSKTRETPRERSRESARPPRAKRTRRSAPPPVPTNYQEPPPVPGDPLTMSSQAAAAVVEMQRSNDKFGARQDRAYDTEPSDVLHSSDEAYELGNSSKKRRAKRKAKVPFKRRRDLRNAVIMREIMERPRCFDI